MSRCSFELQLLAVRDLVSGHEERHRGVSGGAPRGAASRAVGWERHLVPEPLRAVSFQEGEIVAVAGAGSGSCHPEEQGLAGCF